MQLPLKQENNNLLLVMIMYMYKAIVTVLIPTLPLTINHVLYSLAIDYLFLFKCYISKHGTTIHYYMDFLLYILALAHVLFLLSYSIIMLNIEKSLNNLQLQEEKY